MAEWWRVELSRHDGLEPPLIRCPALSVSLVGCRSTACGGRCVQVVVVACSGGHRVHRSRHPHRHVVGGVKMVVIVVVIVVVVMQVVVAVIVDTSLDVSTWCIWWW